MFIVTVALNTGQMLIAPVVMWADRFVMSPLCVWWVLSGHHCTPVLVYVCIHFALSSASRKSSLNSCQHNCYSLVHWTKCYHFQFFTVKLIYLLVSFLVNTLSHNCRWYIHAHSPSLCLSFFWSHNLVSKKTFEITVLLARITFNCTSTLTLTQSRVVSPLTSYNWEIVSANTHTYTKKYYLPLYFLNRFTLGLLLLSCCRLTWQTDSYLPPLSLLSFFLSSAKLADQKVYLRTNMCQGKRQRKHVYH